MSPEDKKRRDPPFNIFFIYHDIKKRYNLFLCFGIISSTIRVKMIHHIKP